MIVSESIAETREAIRAFRSTNKGQVGLVPTMGALHAGHLSLIEAARSGTQFVVVSIFVNPTQFAPGEDLDQYPRPFEQDLQACREAGADLVFAPAIDRMYRPDAETAVSVERLGQDLEGAKRPTHFRGVTTVVAKLLNIVQPEIAYFGQKDYQQLLIIRRMCRDLDMPVEIAMCPIVRSQDGLALSSRNEYLSSDQREAALLLSQSLQEASRQVASGERQVDVLERRMVEVLRQSPLIDVDYAVVRQAENLQPIERIEASAVALVAARVGSTRLIDNLLLDPRQSGQE